MVGPDPASSVIAAQAEVAKKTDKVRWPRRYSRAWQHCCGAQCQGRSLALAADADGQSDGGVMPVFAVTTAKGSNWDHVRGIREQPFWEQHAAFSDTLAERGVIILGGPIASDDDDDIALLAVEAPDEEALRSIFDADPWTVRHVFRVKSVWAWTLWLDGRSR
jgi:uncharacterized protein YciI